jgi:hypothetical protein
MSVSWCRLGVLALAGMAVSSPPAWGQRFNGRGPAAAASINPNYLLAPGLTLGQASFNTAVLGRAYQNVPPYALGYNPYVRSVGNPYSAFGGGVPAITAAANPYALSTAPGGYGGNPYMGGALGTDPGGYALSTNSSYSGGGGAGYGGYSPTTPPGYGVSEYSGGYLRGLADVTAATGRFEKDQQTARMIREQSRQAALDTRRKSILDEAFYERMRPKAQDLRDAELATELNRARRDPPSGEITSGKALNELFRSIVGVGRLDRGPNIPLEDDTVKNINLADPLSRGNVGMIKDLKKAEDVQWPLTFHDGKFDEARKRLSRNLVLAAQQVRDRDPIGPNTLKDLRADFNTISDELAANVGEMAPSPYIEARRHLKQVDDALRALEDPNVGKFFSSGWMAKGKNVAELVDHMKNQGLRFAPATPGDEAAYVALYYHLRNYEAAVQIATK